MQRIICKIDRISAWVLLVGMLLYFISGYGMTKGLIDPTFGAKMHLDYLSFVVMIAFIFHTYYAVHLAFKRWRMWNGFSSAILAVFYIFLLSSFVYVDRYYKKPATSSVGQTQQSADDDDISENDDGAIAINSNANTNTSAQITNQNTNSTTANTFTLAQLAKYNGQNGQSAYVAVDGNVYDLTAIFAQGKHFSHFAGTELTNAFYSYHAKSALAKYPTVGTLVK